MPFNVLLVEQSPVMRQFLRRVVEMPGLPESSCAVAESGAAAAREMADHPPDLIVLDTNMMAPEEATLLQRIRRDPKLQHVPCIVVSEDATATRAQQMLDLGATAYLPKPLAPAALRAAIERSFHAGCMRN
ncbi:MAG TPA: response regulator [Bryobacteraceae bacterium]